MGRFEHEAYTSIRPTFRTEIYSTCRHKPRFHRFQDLPSDTDELPYSSEKNPPQTTAILTLPAGTEACSEDSTSENGSLDEPPFFTQEDSTLVGIFIQDMTIIIPSEHLLPAPLPPEPNYTPPGKVRWSVHITSRVFDPSTLPTCESRHRLPSVPVSILR